MKKKKNKNSKVKHKGKKYYYYKQKTQKRKRLIKSVQQKAQEQNAIVHTEKDPDA